MLSIYRQINAQAAPVLSDVDEDNFDRAFDFLRPGELVIISSHIWVH